MLLINLIIASAPLLLYTNQLRKKRTQPLFICHFFIAASIFKLFFLLFIEHRKNVYLICNAVLLLAINTKLISVDGRLTIFEERLFFLLKNRLRKILCGIYFSILFFNLGGIFFMQKILFLNGIISCALEISALIFHIAILRMEKRQSLNFSKESLFIDKFMYRLSAVGEFFKAVWMLYYNVGYSLVFSSLLIAALDLYISY